MIKLGMRFIVAARMSQARLSPVIETNKDDRPVGCYLHGSDRVLGELRRSYAPKQKFTKGLATVNRCNGNENAKETLPHDKESRAVLQHKTTGNTFFYDFYAILSTKKLKRCILIYIKRIVFYVLRRVKIIYFHVQQTLKQ